MTPAEAWAAVLADLEAYRAARRPVSRWRRWARRWRRS
jgi:hypothetical protein